MSRQKGKVDVAMQYFYGPFLEIGNAGTRKNNRTINKQARLERIYIRNLSELAMNRFKWNDLPSTIDERFLERTLLMNGLVVFFNDPDFGYLALRGTGNGQWNMYDNPTAYSVLGNGTGRLNKTLSAKNCVAIWPNFSRVPDMDIILTYAEKLATLDRTIEINSMNMRQPKVVKADEMHRLSVQNYLNQIEEGNAAILVNGGSGMSESIEVLDMGADPRMLQSLMELKTRMFNEAMMMLGINNNPGQDKKERLVSSEVDANDDQILTQRAVSLSARQQACDVINERYGLNISVSYVNDTENYTSNEYQQMVTDDIGGAS